MPDIKVLFIDPAFKGRSLPLIPLASGLIASHLIEKFPFLEIQILNLVSEIIDYIKKEKPGVIGVSNYMWNTNLAIKISKFAREINPDVLIVFGGHEVSTCPVNKDFFASKYKHVDLLVEHEGELAFSKIMDVFFRVNMDRSKLRENIDELGNCFYVNEDGQFIKSPALERINNLDSINSPYLAGYFDEFLSRGYTPQIGTNRGCPYSCTFCQEGNSYYSKIKFRSIENIILEIDYIAKKVKPFAGLLIVDSNWGMFPQDQEIAERLKHHQETISWPMEISVSTGKSQFKRIFNVVKTLNGTVTLSNSQQSMSQDVLDSISRKNLKIPYDIIESGGLYQEPELILPLPLETADSFIDGLNQLIDSRSKMRPKVYPALLLNDTPLAEGEKGEGNYKLKTMFRQHQNLMSYVEGEFVCETERKIVSTSTMTENEHDYCRMYVMLTESLFREKDPLKEIFYFLDMKNRKRSDFVMKLLEDIPCSPKGVRYCFEELNRSLAEECFETEEEVWEYMEEFSDDYFRGIRGGDLLKYPMMLWIEQYNDFMDWLLSNLQEMFKSDSHVNYEIIELGRFIRCVFIDRDKSVIEKPPQIVEKFDYDFISWSQQKGSAELGDFRSPIEISFNRTEISTTSNSDIWESFGFFLEKDYTPSPNQHGRLYLNKLRRDIKYSKKQAQPVSDSYNSCELSSATSP